MVEKAVVEEELVVEEVKRRGIVVEECSIFVLLRFRVQ